MMQFEIPKERPSIIKVIGVGGGGSNAVNHMFRLGIKGVDFMVCNTDHQALEMSPVPVRVQLGPSLTDGRGAGSIPEIGKNAAIENIDEIRSILAKQTKMVFITAGMGGGTGTGAAPIIASVAKELGILTVAIVTIPFAFEGKKRKAQADAGIEELKKNVDTLLVICNDRLREIHGNLKLTDAFTHADDVLAIAAKSIAETITKTLHINVDFADVQTVLKESGVAIMGSAHASGDDRALSAIMNALDSPLLNDNNIEGARYILLNITSGTTEVTMDELGQITDYIQEQAGNSAEVIMGVGVDETLGERIGVTVIATGFKTKDQLSNVIPAKQEKVVFKLMDDPAPVAEPAKPEATEAPQSYGWAKAFRPAPLIAEKAVAPSTPARQPEPLPEPNWPSAVSFFAADVWNPAEHVAEPVDADTEAEPTATDTDRIVHQLVEEEVVEAKVENEDSDGFVLRVVEPEPESVPAPEAKAEPVATPISTPEAIVTEQPAPEPVAETAAPEPQPAPNTPVAVVVDTPVVELTETVDEHPVSTIEAPVNVVEPMETPIETEQPTAVAVDPAETVVSALPTAEAAVSELPEEQSAPQPVAVDDENTFVFEVNMPVIEENEPEAAPQASALEEPAQPVMKAIPPVEAPVNETPVAEAHAEEAAEPVADDNADAFLRARARIMQLRELSMKMNSSSGLADLEKEPAYKRRNVQLNNLPQHNDPQISRYTLSNDAENKPEIRPNNPFLHDRVD